MKNYLISEAIGDIAGRTCEGRAHRIKKYADFHDAYTFNSTFAGPIAYACYKHMPNTLVYQVLKMLPDRMVDVSEIFDIIVNKSGNKQ